MFTCIVQPLRMCVCLQKSNTEFKPGTMHERQYVYLFRPTAFNIYRAGNKNISRDVWNNALHIDYCRVVCIRIRFHPQFVAPYTPSMYSQSIWIAILQRRICACVARHGEGMVTGAFLRCYSESCGLAKWIWNDSLYTILWPSQLTLCRLNDSRLHILAHISLKLQCCGIVEIKLRARSWGQYHRRRFCWCVA